ncbi:MAG: phosphoribosylamine--glycine ligase [Gammaproteobacteria bacterium]
MKVLIVGGGGREHALAWKVAQSVEVEKVYVAPGNAGTAMEPGVENIAIGADDIDALKQFAADKHLDLTIVGPEVPLVAGIVDTFTEAGLACFGPVREAAMLEGSKSFTKDFLRRHHIPTAAYQTFTDLKQATRYIRHKGAPIVIKADGLAAGKGVIVAQTVEQAVDAVTGMLAGNTFGNAGHRVVVEEALMGEEASFIVLCDGRHILPLASSQDHKTRDDGDKGPNTGGMGAYSPAPVVNTEIHARIMHEIMEPAVAGMHAEGRPYTGFLYAGLMIMADGSVKVLEFNCRFGDPETQPILLRLKSDIVSLCNRALAGELDGATVEWEERAAVGVVLAAAGYPLNAGKGHIISGLEEKFDEQIKIFHAGTENRNGNIVTAGGRVLCVTALGENVTEAKQAAYKAVKKIAWEGMLYRRDIGYRAIRRENRLQN